jgi:hypothetical protein
VIELMMRTWTGLIYLSQNGLEPILSALTLPENTTTRKEIILELIIDILKNASPQEFHEFIPSNKNLKKTINKSQKEGLGSFLQNVYSRPPGSDLMRIFLTMTVICLSKSGLILQLRNLSKDVELGKRASQILQFVLVLCDRLLITERCLKIHDEFDMEISAEMSNIYNYKNLTLSGI